MYDSSAVEPRRSFAWKQDIMACSLDCSMEGMIEQMTLCSELASFMTDN